MANEQEIKNDGKKEIKALSRFIKGVVISDKMDKTVVVAVTRLKKHSKYRRYYKVTKKYKAHDEKNDCKKGDKVAIVQCRPLSRDKKWRVVKKIL